jgi:hypothetical protein
LVSSISLPGILMEARRSEAFLQAEKESHMLIYRKMKGAWFFEQLDKPRITFVIWSRHSNKVSFA